MVSDQISGMVTQFFQLGYCLTAVPFCVHRPSECKRDPGCVSPKLNKLIVLIHISSSVMLVVYIIVVYLGTSRLGSREKPMGIPEFAYLFIFLAWMAHCTVVKIILCTEPQGMQRTLHRIHETERSCRTKRSASKIIRLVPPLLTLLTIIQCLVDLLFIILTVHKLGLPQAIESYAAGVEKASIRLGIDLEHLPYNETVSIIMAALMLAACAFNKIISHFTNQLCLCIALAFYSLVQLSLKEGKNATFEQKLLLLRRLQALSQEVNETCGHFMIFMFITVLPFYSYKIQDALQGRVETVAQVLLTFGPFSLVSYLAAKAQTLVKAELSKMSLLKNRTVGVVCAVRPGISGDHDQPKVLKRLILLSASEIGIRGRVFLVTYSFIGNIAGLIVTYAVVIVQFMQQPPSCNCTNPRTSLFGDNH